MTDDNLVEWDFKTDRNNKEEYKQKFVTKKRRRNSQEDDEANLKNKISLEESNQIIISDATNLTEEDKRKCKIHIINSF